MRGWKQWRLLKGGVRDSYICMSALDLDIRPLKTSLIRLNENFSAKASRAQQFDPCRSLFPRWAQPQAVPPLGASAPVIPSPRASRRARAVTVGAVWWVSRFRLDCRQLGGEPLWTLSNTEDTHLYPHQKLITFSERDSGQPAVDAVYFASACAVDSPSAIPSLVGALIFVN